MRFSFLATFHWVFSLWLTSQEEVPKSDFLFQWYMPLLCPLSPAIQHQNADSVLLLVVCELSVGV